jgi:hypothetical protein
MDQKNLATSMSLLSNVVKGSGKWEGRLERREEASCVCRWKGLRRTKELRADDEGTVAMEDEKGGHGKQRRMWERMRRRTRRRLSQ